MMRENQWFLLLDPYAVGKFRLREMTVDVALIGLQILLLLLVHYLFGLWRVKEEPLHFML